MLWNKKELKLTRDEKLNFSYDKVCWTKKVADLSNFDNTQFKDIVNKISETLYTKYWSWWVGSGALKNVESYLTQTWINNYPSVWIAAKIYKYKYQVYIWNVCSCSSSYTTTNHPSYMSWLTNDAVMWSINFYLHSWCPANSMKIHNDYFWDIYWSDSNWNNLSAVGWEQFTNVSAQINYNWDYISSACSQWNTSMWWFPYGYIEGYKSSDNIFTKQSIEFWKRTDTYYNNMQWKTRNETYLDDDNYSFWNNLILCSD